MNQNGCFLLSLAATAERFSLRPSEIFGIEDDTVALSFDLAAAWRLAVAEREAIKKAQHQDDNFELPMNWRRSFETPEAITETEYY